MGRQKTPTFHRILDARIDSCVPPAALLTPAATHATRIPRDARQADLSDGANQLATSIAPDRRQSPLPSSDRVATQTPDSPYGNSKHHSPHKKRWAMRYQWMVLMRTWSNSSHQGIKTTAHSPPVFAQNLNPPGTKNRLLPARSQFSLAHLPEAIGTPKTEVNGSHNGRPNFIGWRVRQHRALSLPFPVADLKFALFDGAIFRAVVSATTVWSGHV